MEKMKPEEPATATITVNITRGGTKYTTATSGPLRMGAELRLAQYVQLLFNQQNSQTTNVHKKHL